MKINDLNSWSIRHAIFDVVERNILPVENKKQILNFIKEDVSDEQLSCLFECLKDENDSHNSSVLNEMYYDHLKEKSDLPIINENKLNKMRDSVLMEDASDPKTITAKDIQDMILKNGTIATSAWLAKMHFLGGPKEKRKIEVAIGRFGRLYDKTVSASFLHKLAPKSTTISHGAKEIFKSPVKGTWSQMKLAGQHLKSNITLPKLNRKHVRNALITSGVTAAIAASYQIYKHYLSTKGARTYCNKFKGDEKTTCMLKFQINAATMAIASLQDAKGGCSQKSNPQKCVYSLNQDIWKWTQRKNKYIDRLNKLTKSEYKPETKKSSKSDSSPFG